MSDKSLTLGQRVLVVGKDVKGFVAYVGYPTFAAGKWIGVILDEAKGKNNGTVRRHAYFSCGENYGVFVRHTQIQLLDGEDKPMKTSITTPSKESKPSYRRLICSRYLFDDLESPKDILIGTEGKFSKHYRFSFY